MTFSEVLAIFAENPCTETFRFTYTMAKSIVKKHMEVSTPIINTVQEDPDNSIYVDKNFPDMSMGNISCINARVEDVRNHHSVIRKLRYADIPPSEITLAPNLVCIDWDFSPPIRVSNDSELTMLSHTIAHMLDDVGVTNFTVIAHFDAFSKINPERWFS